MPEVDESERSDARVWIRPDDRGRDELIFQFPRHGDLNAAVKELPGRWFDWQRKHWRVPADPLIADRVSELLARFAWLQVAPEVGRWMAASDDWRGLVTVTQLEGEGAFILRTVSGDMPEIDGVRVLDSAPDRPLLPFSEQAAATLLELEGADMDDLARACARELRGGRDPAPASLSVEAGEDGEPVFTLATRWDPSAAREFKALPEAHAIERDGRYFVYERRFGVAVPADPSSAPALSEFVAAHPDIALDFDARDLLDDLTDEHDRAAGTVALSYADDGELGELGLGGELLPFQRAGVRYALDRRRTFIADEQGLGKTVQALATLQADDAFPAVVVCPASMKLVWERETSKWLPDRTVCVIDGRPRSSWTAEVAQAEVIVLNYDILDAHAERIAAREPRALVLDESHYVKNPQARRTKAALALASSLEDDAIRLALTGTPILNRPEELVTQLRALGRLAEFGSGARLARRFKSAAADDRMHWNLRARCYLRRTKAKVLPQLPSKRNETVPVKLSNEQEYRLAESDVIAWLQSQPLDLKAIDAKIAAALRAEQLVRLNQLRQLAIKGKITTAASWIEDFLESGEALVVFAEHVAIQRELVQRFPGALHILGADSSTARQAAVDAFQDPDGPQLIVCSMRAASQGLTLTRASNVAFLELDWTPARHAQAEDRLHRIGQHDAVTAWYLLAPNTIDETMATLLERKRTVIDAVTDGSVRAEGPLVEAVVRELRQRPYHAPGEEPGVDDLRPHEFRGSHNTMRGQEQPRRASRARR